MHLLPVYPYGYGTGVPEEEPGIACSLALNHAEGIAGCVFIIADVIDSDSEGGE